MTPAQKGIATRRANQKDKASYFAEKDRQFAESLASGVWPQDTCEACRSAGYCCRAYGHHIGDCCLHCGNDERNLRACKYRGAK